MMLTKLAACSSFVRMRRRVALVAGKSSNCGVQLRMEKQNVPPKSSGSLHMPPGMRGLVTHGSAVLGDAVQAGRQCRMAAPSRDMPSNNSPQRTGVEA